MQGIRPRGGLYSEIRLKNFSYVVPNAPCIDGAKFGEILVDSSTPNFTPSAQRIAQCRATNLKITILNNQNIVECAICAAAGKKQKHLTFSLLACEVQAPPNWHGERGGPYHSCTSMHL